MQGVEARSKGTMRRKAWLTHTHTHTHRRKGQICETCPLHCVIITQVLLLGTALPSSQVLLPWAACPARCVCMCTVLHLHHFTSHAHHPPTPSTPPPHHTAARFPASQPYQAS